MRKTTHETLKVRMSKELKQKILERASREEQTLSGWLRQLALKELKRAA